MYSNKFILQKEDNSGLSRRNFLKGLIGMSAITVIDNSNIPDFLKFKEKVYITIDDGPMPTMKTIIDNLGEENKATFFVRGDFLENKKRAEIVSEAINRGHSIGNHSYSHRDFSKITEEEAKEEILRTHYLIEDLYNRENKENPRLFRFPYGKSTDYANEFLRDLGYRNFLWSFDTCDWKYFDHRNPASLEQILDSIRLIKKGDIILMHDNKITANNIIPEITRDYFSCSLL